MNKAVLLIDESGYKGYADNVEKSPNDFGLMVGIIVPYKFKNIIKEEINEIISFIQHNGKIHITDITVDAKAELRKSCFNLIKKYNLCWVYDAINVQSFRVKEVVLNEKYDKKCNKDISWNVPYELNLLHAKLFKGVVIKAFALLYEIFQHQKVYLEIISDNLDKGVIKKFKKTLNEHLNALSSIETTGFHKKNKEIVKMTLSVEKVSGIDLSYLKKLKYSIVIDSKFAILADVLSNSVYYHIDQKIKNNNIYLNSEEAIVGHPLEKFVWGIPPRGQELMNSHNRFYNEYSITRRSS